MLKKTRLALLLVCLLPAAAPVLAQGKKIKVTVASRSTVESILFRIAREKGYFAEEGLEVAEVAINGGAAYVLSALASGAVDAGRGTYVFAMNETIKTAGIKLVADSTHFAKGKPGDAYYLVRRELADKVRTYADLKGLRVAIPTAGSMGHVRFVRELEKAGLTEKDVEIKTYPSNTRPLLFAGKEFEVGYFIEPQGSMLTASGIGKVFAGSDIMDEDMHSAMLYYSGKFLKNRDAAQRFMNAYLRAVRYFNSMSAGEAAAFALKMWGKDVPPEVFSRTHSYGDGRLDTAYILAAQDYAISKGLAKVRLEEKDLFDLSFAREAAKELDAREAAGRNGN